MVFVSVPPLMPELPNKNQPEGHTLIIPCQATGDPTPEITWLIEGSSREYDHHHEPVSVAIPPRCHHVCSMFVCILVIAQQVRPFVSHAVQFCTGSSDDNRRS